MLFAYIFIFICLFNLLPAFSPPTWMLLSYLQISFQPNPWVLVILGAAAATTGRLMLAKLSRMLIRNNFLSEKSKNSIDGLQKELEKRQGLTFGVFLFYAFSPFPSNQLFLAYGLTGLRLWLVGVPFFLGRLVSYSFWVMTASQATHHLSLRSLRTGSFLGAYFVIAQIMTFLVLYVFTKIDWPELLKEHKLRWLK